MTQSSHIPVNSQRQLLISRASNGWVVTLIQQVQPENNMAILSRALQEHEGEVWTLQDFLNTMQQINERSVPAEEPLHTLVFTDGESLIRYINQTIIDGYTPDGYPSTEDS